MPQEREAKLAESYGKLRVIAHEQTLSEERRRLMQDMHDSLGAPLMSARRMVQRGEIDEAAVHCRAGSHRPAAPASCCCYRCRRPPFNRR